MDRKPFTPKAYLKVDCPYSFKYLLFMAEAGLLDRIEVIRCDPKNAAFERVKLKLAAATNEPATFPTVEIEPGRYQSDSDQLIEYYAQRNNVYPGDLPALMFYKQGIFPQSQEEHSRGEQRS